MVSSRRRLAVAACLVCTYEEGRDARGVQPYRVVR